MALKEVTDQTFEVDVLQSKKTVLVDFWAEWCGPCRMLAPIVESISNKHADFLTVLKCNTDVSPLFAKKAEISSIPCCIIYQNGKEIHRIIGFKSEDAFEKELSTHVTLC